MTCLPEKPEIQLEVKMLFLIACFEVLSDKVREFEQSAAWLLDKGEPAGANGLAGLYRQWGGERASFLYLAVFEDSEEVERHLRSEEFRTLMGAVNVLGTLTHLSFSTQESIEQLESNETLD